MKFYARILLAQKIILAIGLFVFLGLIVIPVIASDRFVNNGDGTVTDTKTGLMWSAKDWLNIKRDWSAGIPLDRRLWQGNFYR